MADIIVIVVIAIIMAFALKGTIKHFKGEGSCCGGSHSELKIDPKPLDHVVDTMKVKVDDIHCDNCATRIANSLNKLDGINACVSVKTKEVMVESNHTIDKTMILNRIERLGYHPMVQS